MPRIPNFNRNQSFIFCPDDYIPEDSPVRILDAFVNSLNLEELGYITFASSAPGQQPYSRFDLIKLHLYGYINGIRSSRKLAAECSRNIELMWLINGISPSKSLISDFVKVNETAIQNTFKEFVLFLKFAGFVDNKAIVIDGTKIRAQNSRTKYYSIKKIDSTIEYFESQIKHYTDLLKKAEAEDLSDKDIDENAIIPFKEKIDNYQKKVEQFTEFKKNMKDQKLSQITLTDPDSRMMTSHGNSDISYNMQTAVDAKNSLIVTTDVVSDINDTNQLENMVDKAEETLGSVADATIADKGYYNTSQIANCEAKGTDVYVKPSKSKNATNNSDYSIDKFTFDKELNIYICPAGKHLTFKRNLSRRLNKTDAEATVVGYEYFCSDCAGCPHLHQCTNSVDGRRITRNTNQDILDIIEKRFEENPKIYTIRKCVVEHPFGTIKRSLGYTYFLRRGLSAVKTEAALISLAYDLKRLVNISNLKEITKKLREYSLHFHYIFYIFFHFLKKNIKLFSCQKNIYVL